MNNNVCNNIAGLVLKRILLFICLFALRAPLVFALDTNKDVSLNDSSGEPPKLQWLLSNFNTDPALRANPQTGEIEYRKGNSDTWTTIGAQCVRQVSAEEEVSITETFTLEDRGAIWFNMNASVLKYWDGSNVKILLDDSAETITFNGLSVKEQFLATNFAGASPGWSSLGDTHTLNIPMANAANVSAGLISNTEYEALKNKQESLGYLPGSIA